jgi:phage gp36-like protein
VPVVNGTVYAVRGDLVGLGLMGGALANVPTTVQDNALQAASGLIDSYIGGRYTLPLTTWGQDLLRACCVIAAYDLLTSRGFGMVNGPDDNIRLRYLDIIKWLEDIRDGETPISGGGGSSATAGAPVVYSSPLREWTSRGNTGDTGP